MDPSWVEPADECPPHALEMLWRVAKLIERDLRLTLDPAIECSAFEEGEGLFVRAIWPPTIQQDLWAVPDWNEATTVTRVVWSLQWSDFFDLYYDPWPRCALHPDSTHSMEAKRFGDKAWWICPESGMRTTPVGALASPD